MTSHMVLTFVTLLTEFDCSSLYTLKYAGKQPNSVLREFKSNCRDRLLLGANTESATLPLPLMTFNIIVSREAERRFHQIVNRVQPVQHRLLQNSVPSADPSD